MMKVNDLILKYIANFDTAGSSDRKIDTLLEFSKLGEYLNGSYVDENSKTQKLSKKEMRLLQEVYNEHKNRFTNFAADDSDLPVINTDNAHEYANLADKLFYSGDKDEVSRLTCEKIQKALYKFAIDNGYDLSHLKYDECDYFFIIREVKNVIRKKQEREELALKTLELIDKPYDNSKLKKSLEEFQANKNNANFVPEQSTGIDFGNGKFDGVATQKTNVCWALAGINSLLTTDEGKLLLKSNHYYDPNSGVFAIHLQEAEDNDLHDGIYFVTPDDIRAEEMGASLAEGEGDITAYLVAVKKYFDEVHQNPKLAQKMEDGGHSVRNLNDGNYGFRFFEILTGGMFSKYGARDIDKPFQNGIGTGTPSEAVNFHNLYDLIKNKSGAVTMAIAEHSISVIGVRDGKLIVQESNNSESFSQDFADKQRNHIIFNRIEDINGAPAYELSEKDFKNYIDAVSFLKWK